MMPDRGPRPSRVRPLAVTGYTLVTAAGAGLDAHEAALRSGAGGLVHHFLGEAGTYIGPVGGLDDQVPAPLSAYDSRNNRLALRALAGDGFREAVAAACARHGAHRVAVVVGTSTSGLSDTEQAYRQRGPDGALPEAFDYRGIHNTFSLADFCRQVLATGGPALSISTACSSSAKAFAVAHRLMATGQCEAVVVGGADTLCATTLGGFHSLALVSPSPCKPFAVDRDGISLGEAAGFALLEWPDSVPRARVLFTGYGESSDAHHMSTPHPAGLGAAAAMRQALARAGIAAPMVDYANLHGTASVLNDRAEALAVAEVLGAGVPCSSTKGWTGHTLGASGIVEAALGCLCLERQLLPGTLNTTRPDPTLRLGLVTETRRQGLGCVLSNSFGFGGSNCSLVFQRLP